MGKPVSEWQNSVTFNTFTGIAMLHIQCLKRAKERKTEESKHSRALVTQPPDFNSNKQTAGLFSQ